MKKTYIITIITAIITVFFAYIINTHFYSAEKKIRVGIIYESDASTAFASNFMEVEKTIKDKYNDQVQIFSQYNVADVEPAIIDLIQKDCDLILANSYEFGVAMKEYAHKYPNIEFCQATCMNANEEPYYPNYHTFMGEIYQGRYISGVVAGLKLKELMENEIITNPKVGYVAAYPYPEVISGYTAFFLGIRSIVPETTMDITYTNSWSSYLTEKKLAKKLIDDGCVIISQHSDTIGPAVACEEAQLTKEVYHIGYNQNMDEVAPTSHLISTRINWEPYIMSAVDAVLTNKKIESVVKGNVHGLGNDMSASFKLGWVQMLPPNKVTIAEGTEDTIQHLINDFNHNRITVFQGDYKGTNPMDPSDTFDLKDGYLENKDSSAPTFPYVLEDVITVKEY